jgi:hypothetical protein
MARLKKRRSSALKQPHYFEDDFQHSHENEMEDLKNDFPGKSKTEELLPPTDYQDESEIIDAENLEQIKNQVALLHQGFAVKLLEIKGSETREDHLVLKVTLKSNVNRMPVFGDVRIRLTRQLLHQLKLELDRF